MIGINPSDLAKLDGTVVVIESLRNHGGSFVDAYHDQELHITGCGVSKLPDAVWSKFVIHHIKDNIVCFESLRYRDHYIDIYHDTTHDRHIMKVTQSNIIPKYESWALFSIWGSTFDNVAIRSEKWTNRWWDAYHGEQLLGVKHDSNRRPLETWGEFKISFPAEIKEHKRLVASQENNTGSPMDFEYQYQLGVSRTDGESISNSVTVSVEVQKNFGTPEFTSGHVKFGTSYTRQWSSQTSTTYSASTVIKGSQTIPPGKQLLVYQLEANYGPLVVYSNHLDFRTQPVHQSVDQYIKSKETA